VLLPHKAKEALPILNSMNAMAVVQDNCPSQWAYDWSWQECTILFLCMVWDVI